MNVTQLEVRMSKEFTPSSSRLKLMGGIPQLSIIVPQEQLIRYAMPKIVIVTYKFR
jgi:hypothetical protein